MEQEEDGPITGFLISSDRYRNKCAYYISWKEYMKFINIAVHSEVVKSHSIMMRNNKIIYLLINE